MANTCNGDRPAFQVIVHSNAPNGETATWESKLRSAPSQRQRKASLRRREFVEKSITLARNPDSSVHAVKVLIVAPSQNNHDSCAYY